MSNQGVRRINVLFRSAAFLILPSVICSGMGLGAATQTKGAEVNNSRASKTSQRKVNVTELKSLNPLKEAFERDSGKVRLLMILSPT